MLVEFFENGNLRGLLALVVVVFVLVIYLVALIKNNEKVIDRLTQSLVTIIALIITFYFVIP